jgi:predicted transcriptional regulator
MTVIGDTVPGLGPLESAIMTVVWDAGQALTVRVARERLDYRASGGGEPAYTTVMTVMNILWRKGLLSRAKDLREGHARAWWYEAHVTREEHLAAVILAALECAPDPAAVMRRAHWLLVSRSSRAKLCSAAKADLRTPPLLGWSRTAQQKLAITIGRAITAQSPAT